MSKDISEIIQHTDRPSYLKLTQKINNRQLLTKFRTSDHPLEIELGRYNSCCSIFSLFYAYSMLL
jgi:hypothetical protein